MRWTTTLAMFTGVAASCGYCAQTRASEIMSLAAPEQFLPPRYRVSLVVPAYNEEKYIGNLLHSAQNQSEPFSEIIVCDCSDPEDNTPSISEQWGARVIKVPYGNLSNSKNVGAQESSGNILVFADADMILDNCFVTSIVDVLETGVSLALPRLVYYDSMFYNTLLYLPQMLRRGTMAASSCQAMSVSVFNEVGGYDVECNSIQAWCPEQVDFAQRVARIYGEQSVQVLPFLVGTSARRYRRFGIGRAGMDNFGTAVRNYLEV